MESNEQNNTQQNGTPASKLEAVRDLIFGQELEELDQRLSSLATEIDNKDAAIHQDIQEMQGQLGNSIAKMQQNILDKISEVQQAAEQELQRQNSAQVSKKEMGQILGSIAQQLDHA